jgi:hypothetical protein
MNSRRLSIVGIIALLFVVGCSTTLTPTATPAPPQALATATVPTHAPTAAPSLKAVVLEEQPRLAGDPLAIVERQVAGVNAPVHSVAIDCD